MTPEPCHRVGTGEQRRMSRPVDLLTTEGRDPTLFRVLPAVAILVVPDVVPEGRDGAGLAGLAKAVRRVALAGPTINVVAPGCGANHSATRSGYRPDSPWRNYVALALAGRWGSCSDRARCAPWRNNVDCWRLRHRARRLPLQTRQPAAPQGRPLPTKISTRAPCRTKIQLCFPLPFSALWWAHDQ